MENTKPYPANKKTWQKPNFWILDTCIEGGAGANVREATGLTPFNNPGQPGFPARTLYTPNGGNTTPNWTSAHS